MSKRQLTTGPVPEGADRHLHNIVDIVLDRFGPERFTSLMDDLERKIFGPLPDETWVYPGHGKDTTLGTERPHLNEWRERGW